MQFGMKRSRCAREISDNIQGTLAVARMVTRAQPWGSVKLLGNVSCVSCLQSQVVSSESGGNNPKY